MTYDRLAPHGLKSKRLHTLLLRAITAIFVLHTLDARTVYSQDWITFTDPNFRIAVVDTGVNYLHEDLIDNIWTNVDAMGNPKEAIGDMNGDGCPRVCGVDDDESGNNVDIFQLHWIMEADRISGSCGVTYGLILMEGLS